MDAGDGSRSSMLLFVTISVQINVFILDWWSLKKSTSIWFVIKKWLLFVLKNECNPLNVVPHLVKRI